MSRSLLSLFLLVGAFGCSATPSADEALDAVNSPAGIKLSSENGLVFSLALFPTSGRFSRTFPVRLDLERRGSPKVVLGCVVYFHVDGMGSASKEDLSLYCTDPDDVDLVDVVELHLEGEIGGEPFLSYSEMGGEFFVGGKELPWRYSSYPLRIVERTNDPMTDVLALRTYFSDALVSVWNAEEKKITPAPAFFRTDASFPRAEPGARRKDWCVEGFSVPAFNFSKEAKVADSVCILKDAKKPDAGFISSKAFVEAFLASLHAQ